MMMVKPNLKKIVLYVTLVVTLLLTAYGMYEDSVNSAAKEDSMNSAAKKTILKDKDKRSVISSAEHSQVNVVAMKNNAQAKVDIFEVYNKPKPVQVMMPQPTVAPKKIIATPAPITPAPIVVAPSAPALPFGYIGKLFGGGELQVFVELKGSYFSVKEGDIIQKTYKVEKIAPPIMKVTYIPMNVLQDMQIGR